VIELKPSEAVLTGQSIRKDGRIVGDDVCERIRGLIKSFLVKVGHDSSGWGTIYRDPQDGRYWKLTYPNSQMHGGGPPQQTYLSPVEVQKKYGHHIVTH
jgi:hypothetical protein